VTRLSYKYLTYPDVHTSALSKCPRHPSTGVPSPLKRRYTSTILRRVQPTRLPLALALRRPRSPTAACPAMGDPVTEAHIDPSRMGLPHKKCRCQNTIYIYIKGDNDQKTGDPQSLKWINPSVMAAALVSSTTRLSLFKQPAFV